MGMASVRSVPYKTVTDGLTASLLLGGMPLAAVSGVVRGVTGFGGAMVFTAPMALLAAPRLPVAVALFLETFAAVSMLPTALRHAHAHTWLPMSAAACLTVPVGGYLLVALDPDLVRTWITATVLVLATLMLHGFRYTSPPRTPTSTALGGISGILGSATSMSGPPVILYLLSGPDPAATTRANLTLFIMIVSAAALLALAFRGVVNMPAVTLAIVLGPGYLAGVWLGSLIFRHMPEYHFRRYVLLLLIALSLIILVR